jgi:energy-coupling factor transport system permease protein
MLGSSYTFAGYIPGDSWMHRLDPRTKVLIFLSVLACAVAVANIAGLAILATAGALAVAFSSPRREHALGIVKLLAVLAAAALLLNAVFTPGRALPGPFETRYWPTHEGLERGAAASLRLVCLACVAFALVSTTCPRSLGDTVERAVGRIPPFRGAGLALNVAGRFAPDLLRDARRVRAIRSVRGSPYGRGIAGKLKEAGASVLPLMISAIRRAERLSDAMAARCYRGPAVRGANEKTGPAPADLAAVCFTALACGAALLLRGV